MTNENLMFDSLFEDNTKDLIEKYIPEKKQTEYGIGENDEFKKLSPLKKNENDKIGRKIVKKVAKIQLMNEFEKAKAKGMIATIKFTLQYIYGYKHEEFIKIYKKYKNKFDESNLATKITIGLLLILTLPITTEVLITVLSVIGGISGCKLGYYLLTAVDVEDALIEAGVYDTVIANLKKLEKIYPDLTQEMFKHKKFEHNGVKLADELLMKGR